MPKSVVHLPCPAWDGLSQVPGRWGMLTVPGSLCLLPAAATSASLAQQCCCVVMGAGNVVLTSNGGTHMLHLANTYLLPWGCVVWQCSRTLPRAVHVSYTAMIAVPPAPTRGSCAPALLGGV
jgi:hypothetical protein